jgi:hypothetical protein
MSDTTGRAKTFALGGLPRANLLPPEILLQARARRQRVGLLAVIVAVVVLVGGAYVGVSLLAAGAQARLTAAQDETLRLIAEQGKYIEIQTLQSKVAGIKAGQVAGTATEIDWESYLDGVQKALPGDASLQSATITSSTPITPMGAPTSPLDRARVAELVLTAQTKDVPDIVEWIDALATLPGYADSTPTNVTSADDGYQLTFTMHVNDEAISHRFADEEGAE